MLHAEQNKLRTQMITNHAYILLPDTISRHISRRPGLRRSQSRLNSRKLLQELGRSKLPSFLVVGVSSPTKSKKREGCVYYCGWWRARGVYLGRACGCDSTWFSVSRPANFAVGAKTLEDAILSTGSQLWPPASGSCWRKNNEPASPACG